MAPGYAAEPPVANLNTTPDVVNGVAPPIPGSDALPSLDGPAGLLRTSAAEVGAPLQLRVGLAGRYFSASDFLIDGDRDLRLQGALSLGFTPLRFLEVFAAVSGSANRNQRICTERAGGTACVSEPGRNDPEVIKSYGDLTLGSKFAYPLSGGVSAGGELGVRLLSSVSGISFNPDATSVWLSALGTYDMRDGLNLPIRLHLNVGLYFDNSAEVQNYRGISRPSKAVSQFAYGIARDRVRGALAAEGILPIPTNRSVVVRPFAEYHLEMVTSDADPTFADFMSPICRPNATPMTGGTPCRDNRDQQWLTAGVRMQLAGQFAVTAAVDLALHSVGFPYGPPLPPWELTLGVAHPFDLAAPRYLTRTVVIERKIAADKPSEGFATGKVLGAPAGTPVEGAIVAVQGRQKSRVATDPDGTFKTAALPVGVVDLEISAPGFQSATVRTSIAAGLEAPVAVTLTPRVKSGKISGKVTDDKGKPVAATVKFAGAQNAEVKTDDTGAFSTSLPGGSYVVRVEADKFMARELKVELTDGKEEDASVTVKPRPTSTRVTVRDGKITVRAVVAFRGVGPTLDVTPGSSAVLDEVADAIISHPEIKRVRVEAHWDTSLPKDKAQELTEQQARTVAAYLTKQGVPSDRLEVAGLGASKPIVPNIGMAKLRNRRVEFRAIN
jgi:outer membrane protein OmpA-like peptidoglycan-associated protein